MGLLDQYTYEDILRKNANSAAYYGYEPNDNPVGFDMPVERTPLEDILKQLYADPTKPVKVKERTQVSYDKTGAKQTYGEYTLDEYGMLHREDASQFYRKPVKSDVSSKIGSVLTGGISDLFQGNPMGSGSVGLINEVFPEHTFLGKVVPSLLLPAESGYKDIDKIWSGNGNFIDKFSNTFERMADPTNSVNYSLEHFGSVLPKEVKDVLPAVLAAIGTAVYPVAGTALGYGIGSHLKGDTSTQALLGAGTSAIASYLGGLANSAGSELFGNVAGKAAGNLTSQVVSTGGNILKGLIAPTIAQVATQYNTQSDFSPVPYSISGLMNTPRPKNYIQPESKLDTPSFEKTALPKLSTYEDDNKKKLAEILTNPYKNYTLNDYALYKADPEKLQELIGSQYLA